MGGVGLAAIAGCSGSDTDASSEGDTGASETPGTSTGTDRGQTGTDQQQTVASGPLDPPPGTSENGIDDPATLIEATKEGLLANGYVIENQYSGSDGQTTVLRTRSDPEQQQYRSLIDGPSMTIRQYVGDGTFYIKSTSDGETQYDGGNRIESFATFHEENDQIQNHVTQSSLLPVLEAITYTPGETITRDQRRLLRFDGASRSDDESAGGVVDSKTYLYVSAESHVFESAVAIEDADGGTTDYSFRIDEFGDVTVTEPDWVETARQRTQ